MDPTSPTVISVHQLQKTYSGHLAVSGLTFQVEPGQVLGLIGPNGAGKTTTLRAISGIIPASGGRLKIAGHDLAQDPVAAKRALAYIPDDPQLFPDLTVEEHLAFTGAVYDVEHVNERAEKLLETFELTHKRHTPARDLSRGMKQKLAICCGYLHDPLAILFDEPLTGLDPLGIRTLKDSILARADAGAAVIVSSHLLAMVEDICTHVLILKLGEQRFFGPLDDLKQAYQKTESELSLERIFFLATEHHESAAPTARV